MSKKTKKNDYLPFMDFEERPTCKFGKIPEDCRLHVKEGFVRQYLNPLNGESRKGYFVDVEYTFAKGKVETNKSEKIFSEFIEQFLDILSPVMDYCEAVNVEVKQK